MSDRGTAVDRNFPVRTAGGLMRALLVVLAGLLVLPSSLLQPAAAASPSDVDAAPAVDLSVNYAPDVVGQFNALSERADALGFGIGPASDPSACRHYQGLARSTGPGVPYLFVTPTGTTTRTAARSATTTQASSSS